MSATLDSQIEREWLELSLAQRPVWLDASLSSSASAYTLVRRARIAGAIDADLGRQALTLVVARHDALRLRVDDELPRQWLHPAVEAPFSLTDLSADAQPEAALEACIARALADPMPLGDRPLFSLELFKLGDADHCVLLRCHHLLVDDAAISMMLYHWLAAYCALRSDTPVELAPPSSYLSVIAADATYERSARYKTDLKYWLGRFASPSPPLLPARRSSPAALDAAPNLTTWLLEGDGHRRFLAATAAAGVTPQRAITTLLALVLGRRYGQSDLTLGMALHRRNAANFHVVGMLAGVIPIRHRFGAGLSLVETMRALSAQIDRDLRHERLPIDALSRELGLSRAGLSELLQVAVSYVPAMRGAFDIPLDGLALTMETIPSHEASPLTLHAKELDDGRGLALDIATDAAFLDGAETERIALLLRDAIELFSTGADAPARALPGTTPAERTAIVETWNATAAAFPAGTADEVFEQRVREAPDAVAVSSSTHALTYAELDARSNRLAHLLIARGLTPQAVVGVALERSVSTVVSLLAILKAGCTYLPLDPAYPPERLAYMLADAGASAVVTDAGISASLPADVARIFIDEPGESDAFPASAPPRSHTPQHTSYIIYTSGSTGKPKGVAVPHAALVNLAFARLRHDPIGAGDRILAAISVGFDVSLGQLLLPLTQGATIVIASDLRTLSAQEFWDFIVAQRVTHINSVPSFFESILDAAPRSTGLVRVMLGGEPLTAALVRRLQAALPATQIVNMYGPTEACIDATCHPAGGDETSALLPIGRPLPNYRAYVLDASLDPAGIGIAGDLYLAGAGLAHGYVNAAALTAERFIPDPFGAPGTRLYKTGDRARWNPDGTLDFLGRADQQIKIRGHRIELGEIEAALRTHPAVAAAAVVANDDRPGATRLVAYVVYAAPARSESAALRAHLAAQLPDYMLPSAFAELPALPLTPNGKLDERALPEVGWESERAYVEPRTERERDVAALFAELLGVKRAGATDNFFELGGHSLLATRLVSQVRARFGITLPLRAVFEAPSVEALARRLERAEPGAHARFVPVPRPDRLPLSFTQERLWFLSQLQSGDTYNVPVAVRIRGPLDMGRAVRALELVVAHHEALRTCIEICDGGPVAIVRDPDDFTVETIDLSGLAGDEQQHALERRLRDLAHHAFDLAAELPIKLEIVTLASGEAVVAAVVHHTAFDGWSAALFFEEFSRFYAGAQNGSAQPPSLHYADFAVWQRQQDYSGELDYWRERLAGAPALLEFPADRVAADLARRPAAQVPILLDEALHQSLLEIANANGASLFMLLHAAFATLLGRWSGQNDVVIGTVVANRRHVEFERVIGCFINTLPLRTSLEPLGTFTQLLARVREDDLAAYEHQNVPFEKLVDTLQPDRSLSHTPLFQTMLVLQNDPTPEGAFPGLDVEPVALELGVAKFNLTLNLGRMRDGTLAGTLEYAGDTYEAATMERFAGQFVRLLGIVAANPSVTATQVDLLAPDERRRLLEEWNASAVTYPRGTADAFVDARARESAGEIAVTSATETLTYAELDVRSNRLAHLLIERGLPAQSVVGVALERSVATVVSLLAILKAGCIYLPLDPAYPPERLAFMLSDAGARSVITDATHAGLLPAAVPRIIIDAGDRFEHLPKAAPPRSHTPAHAAYIIYTSGSTGKPKGVAVPHSALVNLAFARLQHDPIGPGDRILAAISVGFDVSIGQLLLPLLSGATIVIADDLRTLSASEFWQFLEDHRVTHVNSVPSFFESILDAAPASSSLVRLMLGGEPLTAALARRLRRALPDTSVVNMYGPTEACIDATAHPFTGHERDAVLPIGKPLPNYRAYVLGPLLDPVGIGIAGDLYLAGAGLAHGYVNEPALTAERFIAHPFGAPGERLYKTGDRARWTAEGTIEFLGRADNQVKIRGHRIELGEIEARMTLVPGIDEAAVVVRDDAAGERRLIGYFTAPQAIGADDVRAALAGALPGYMIPAAFVRLDAFPLTANGKLDRAALPAPAGDAFAQRAFEPPLGEREGQIAAIIAATLALDRVGRHDNFFELGGHSLLAIAVVERMRQAGLQIGVRDLFSEPTVAGLAAASGLPFERVVVPPNLIAPGTISISPGMLPLVDLTQREIDAIVAAVPGGAANVADIYPLAPLQEGILFRYLSSQSGDPYLTPFLLAFDSRKRLDGFLGALREIVGRHDILRTAILWENLTKPVQVVVREAILPVEEVAVDDDAPGRAADELKARYDPRHFRIDIRQAPMLRAFVARDAADGRWLLMLLSHHLILDHASLEVVLQEIDAIASGRRAALMQPAPFRNFIAKTQRGVPQHEHETFFRAMLGDVDEPTLPFGLAGVENDGSGIREASALLDAALAARLRRRARALGVGPATLFHLAWALVVARAADRTDVVFGTLLFGRMDSGEKSQRTLGMFINTLPLRIKIDAAGVESAVLQTHRLLTGLLRHEHASLALAQRCSAVAAPAPLFSTLFNFRHSPPGGGNGTWSGVELLFGRERTDYPIALAVDDRTEDFSLTAQADAGIEPARLCEAMETALRNLLDALETAPQTPLRTIGVMPAAEHALVTLEWNRTDAAYPNATLHALFEAQAARTPAAVAVTSGTETLSFAELDARADALADFLAARGAGLASVVGVALPRSVSTVVSFIAILKLGAVYLPLDPAYPADRLAYLIADSGARLVIVDDETAALVPSTVVHVDIDAASSEAPRRATATVRPADIAYVIYTSGSTGRPKGVAVSHASAVNLAFARLKHDPISSGDRILAAISVGFDVSIGQLLLPLLHGATVVIASDLRTLTPAEFWAFLAAQRITHVNSVPSFFESILAAAPQSTTLVRVMLGGEPLTAALVRRLRAALPGTQIVNMYGPTEACIDATCYIATGDERTAVLPIGKPLPNYRAYVLNALLEPAGIGIAGDLYLAGPGLAYAYLNQPALTAESFIPDPFGAPGDRLYKTGDRARRRADGTLEFLGRADGQVKIRGHRIEAGEIEAHLRRVSGVREAVVIAREDVAGERRLVAYYTAEAPLPAETLRAALTGALPAYMVPAAYVHLAALPLTTNGKLHRKALPAPGADAYTVRGYEAPRGGAEERTAAIFAGVLKLERVGRHDNFFELGGHSLLAMNVIELMRQAGLHVDVRALFTAPTVADLAAAARDAAERIAVPPNLIPADATAIVPAMLTLVALGQHEIDAIARSIPGGAANIQDIYPLAPLQEGILFRHLMSDEGDAYVAPFVMGFDRRERLDAFLDAMRTMIARHDILRTAILWQGLSLPVQVVVRDAVLPVEEVTLDEDGDGDALTALRERFDPRHFRMEIRQAPMLRAFIAYDRANGRWLLLLLSHHLILDHTSLEVILAEVAQIAAGGAQALPPVQPFRNFIAAARLGISSDDHEAFFRDLLGDVDEPTLPYGATHVAGDGSGIREARAVLDGSLTQRLRDRARALGVGPSAIFHLAWALVLARTSGRDDVVFGTLLFGRMHNGEDSSRTLGMFINTLPMRVAIDATSVEAATRRTHRQLADLLRHEHASLALAQRCSRVPAPAPLFSALFNFRQSPPTSAAGTNGAWKGVELLFVQERTDYPVALAVDDRTGDFQITAQADAPADARALCASMETAVVNLLATLEHDPHAALRTIDVLPQAERERVVSGWNATHAAVASGALATLFEAQAARTPDALAVTSGTETLTYAELDARADAFADLLASQGAERQSVVGVALPRSASTVVALLAILKIGAVYLPLDPAYPADRLRYMIDDAGARIVITNSETAGLARATVIEVDVDSSRIARERRPVDVRPADIAYIIYTSGSTGKPKGVAVPHSALANLAFARLQHDPIGPGDRILAAISVGFDVSLGQLLLPLLSGATVVIARDLRTQSAREFWQFLEEQRVTHVNSVPSFFESILEAAPPSSPLVRLMLGGEALTSALVRRLQAALPATQIVNMYGPTEACIDATAYPATGDEGGAVLPIGRPLPNYRAYVLNGALDPVGPGIGGDLYLAGAGLAYGYVGAPALTAERFIADPFGAPGERLYKTGDRARWTSEGTLEFLGRADNQVKIRGHRVELGEVEAALATYPGIEAAAVVASARANGSAALIAYLVPADDGAAIDTAALRDHVKTHLPEHMIPAFFETIDALPLTINGKLDAAALPAPSLEHARDVAYEAPQSGTEAAMLAIWQDVLGVASLGRNDNFFSCGGNSLAAVRLIATCGARFDVNLPLKLLFTYPTIAQFSAAIDTGIEADENPTLVPLRTGGDLPPIFCIHPAGGLLFCYGPLVDALGAGRPIYGLTARGIAENEPLALTIEDMAADYLRAIRAVQPNGPYQLLGMSSGGLIAFEMAQQLKRQGEDVPFLCLLDTSLPERLPATTTTERLLRDLANELGIGDLFENEDAPASTAALLERAWASHRLPREVTLAFAERVVAVFRNTIRVYRAYEPHVWTGPLVLFRALRRLGDDAPPDWSAYAPAASPAIDVDCEHMELLAPHNIPALVAHIEPLLLQETHGKH